MAAPATTIESLDEIDEAIRHAAQSTHVNADVRAKFIDALLDARLKAKRNQAGVGSSHEPAQ